MSARKRFSMCLAASVRRNLKIAAGIERDGDGFRDLCIVNVRINEIGEEMPKQLEFVRDCGQKI